MSDDPTDNDLLAAEYVIGLLSPEQARALEALALHDPAVAASVEAWANRLAPLAAALPPVQPPALLWRRLALAAGIDRQAKPGRRGLLLWRGLAGTGFAIAACLALFLLQPREAAPSLVAALAPAGAPAPAFLIRVAAGGQAVVVAGPTAVPPPGRSFELWQLKPGAASPTSLGVLPATGQRRFLLDAGADTQLLVSQEPPGGSPTGQPTGPVVFAGVLGGV